ncbi:hypothetical protein KC316_g499 [Hortaea werneckii]|nr:hypothetical protein KC324_g617 [Hortaea werneckii]KAI7595501.1 hypothetical protein KC316_g499 [Hortaea werneckii]
MNAGLQPEGDHASSSSTTTSAAAVTHHNKGGQPKALRFVTNYGAPHPKRRRIGAACLTCRKRKTACSGERPTCDTCKQNKLECAGYNTEPDGDGRKRSMSEVNTRQAPEVKERQRVERAKRKSPPDTRQEREKDTDTFDPALSHAEAPDATATTSSSSSKPDGPSPPDAPTTTTSRRAPELAVTAHPPADLDSHPGPEPLFSGSRNRMPYFRWLGPTAIMPGFKQMVVKIKRNDTDPMGRSSTDGMLSPSLGNSNPAEPRVSSLYTNTPTAVESDVRTPLNLPFYDTSPMPPSELITHLANTFFTHLGCNYHFLQRDRFLRDLQEKQVDAILVDAVCALAARFSNHQLLTQQPHEDAKLSPSDYGHAFARRAKVALVDAFAYPTPAAVQAALLLAYNEFGESRDSGLWMYLGIAIRMAEDLGMHKLEGLKFRGKSGPTPRMVTQDSHSDGSIPSPVEKSSKQPDVSPKSSDKASQDEGEQEAVEQERVDTFWAIFFLDRVVSSGTGRRSTLRDKDIELSFPSLDETDPKTGWPAPFPALIRIVHLYGRVADLLNCIKEPSDITPGTPKRLAAMESQVTNFYQGLSPRLHFDAVNFQHYMKAGEGTNFVLLHFWFHTLIVLLHQPTLLKTFEGHILQLFPNSQQLSMSSAKTIADILSYSQLMDAKASLGNPFTTQPIYIAACAFLKETAEQTATSKEQSRSGSPNKRSDSGKSSNGDSQNGKKPGNGSSGRRTPNFPIDQKTLARHTLLATAASQHYQLCYKALQSVETYWGGTKYILTVLDQKFEGVGDPLLYTAEEGESSMERPRPDASFTSPGWRRKLSWGPYHNNPPPLFKQQPLDTGSGSPSVGPSQAIGWTLTGTMDSPNTNLAWHYPSASGNQPARGQSAPSGFNPTDYDAGNTISGQQYQQHARTVSTGGAQRSQRPPLVDYPSTASGVSAADADLLLGLGSPYTQPNSSSHQTPGSNSLPFTNQGSSVDPPHNYPLTQGPGDMATGNFANPYFGQLDSQNFGDMMIQSQDVDMSMLGLDMMPWFDSYPTHDLNLSMFDPAGTTTGVDTSAGASTSTQQPASGRK